MQVQTPQNIFLDEFTLEIILNLVKIRLEQVKIRTEEERAKKSIEVGRMKVKFQDYPTKPYVQQTTQPKQIIQIREAPKKSEGEKEEKYLPSVIPIIPQTKYLPQKQPQIVQQNKIKPPQNVFHKELNEKKNLVVNSNLLKKTAIEKILELLQNPQIDHVECTSEGQNIIVRKTGQTIKTNIILSKEEVIEVIKYFSEKARIPLIEGMLLARIENLDISAVVSENTKSSFIIKKLFTQTMSPMTMPLRTIPQTQSKRNFLPPINNYSNQR